MGHWVSEQPIPIAGFNLGEYVRSTAEAGTIEVDAYAARGTEDQRSTPNAANRSRHCCRRMLPERSSQSRCRRPCRILPASGSRSPNVPRKR